MSIEVIHLRPLRDCNDPSSSPSTSKQAKPSTLSTFLPRRASVPSSSAPSPPRDTSDVDAAQHAVELAPIDGGSRAWLFLTAAFVTEMICLGGAFSFSIFQDYLVQSPHSPLRRAPNSVVENVGVSAIGTLLVCTSYFAPALLRGVWARFALWNRTMGFACLQLAGTSLIVASFGVSVPFLAIFMGVVPGVLLGLGTLNYLIWLPQWFLQRRGLANGIAFAGAGTGGIMYPFILNAALRSVGFAWTMRVWAAIIMIVGGLSSLLLRPRIAPRRQRSDPAPPDAHRPTPASATEAQTAVAASPATAKPDSKHPVMRTLRSLAFLTSPLMMLNVLATFLASMSFFSVSFYLAVYCASLGLGSGTSTGIVAAFNAAALTGEIVIGHACDRYAYPPIIFGIAAAGSLSAFLLFGLAHSLVGVVFFVLLFGMAAGSWCSVWTPAAYDVSRLHNMQTANVLLAFTIPRGLAAAVGPLIAAALYHPEANTAKAIFGAFGFGSLIAFVGACMLVLLPIAPLIAMARRKAFSAVDPSTLYERL